MQYSTFYPAFCVFLSYLKKYEKGPVLLWSKITLLAAVKFSWKTVKQLAKKHFKLFLQGQRKIIKKIIVHYTMKEVK